MFWRTVLDSHEEKPAELDTTSSPTTVYKRRNIHKKTMPSMGGEEETSYWEYEQAEMTREEWQHMETMQAINDVAADIAMISLGV